MISIAAAVLAAATWLVTITCPEDTSLLLICKGTDTVCVAAMTKLKETVGEQKVIVNGKPACATDIKILD